MSRQRYVPRQGKRLDIGSAYVDAAQIIEKEKPQDPFYVYVFQKSNLKICRKVSLRNYGPIRSSGLAGSRRRDIEGYMYFWEI